MWLLYRKGNSGSFNSLAQAHAVGTHTQACPAPHWELGGSGPSPRSATDHPGITEPASSFFFLITEARLENGPSGSFKLYYSGKVDLMKSQSGPGRGEGCVWARQDPHPQLTAQHPPTKIQRRQGTGPGLQSISHRLLPLPRGPAGKLLQLYWDDEGSLGWWKCRRGDVKIHGGRSDLFSLEKGSQKGPVFKSPVSMGLGWKG